jgi:DNA-binding transcriptional regulator YdaS (Cro superfamily)
MKKQKLSGIQKAIAAVGTQTEFADQLGCTQQSVSEWMQQGFAPWQRAVEIESITGVPRNELVDPRILSAIEIFTG